MGTKKWSEIKKLSKATESDRAEARAELEAEIRHSSGGRTIQELPDRQDELADKFEDSDPNNGREVPVKEYLERRRTLRGGGDGREFGNSAARGRPRLDREAIDSLMERLASHGMKLPENAVGYEPPSTCPACDSTDLLWGCDDEVHDSQREIHPLVWHETAWMADSYVCRACDAGWIEPDEPEPISWVRPYWIEDRDPSAS